MGDISRNTGRAVIAGRGGKPRPKPRTSKQVAPVSGLNFEDNSNRRFPSMAEQARPPQGEVSVEAQRELPVEAVEGPSAREQIDERLSDFRRNHPIAATAAAVAGAAANGRIEGRIRLNKPSRRP